jgi:hypothetical protein
VNLQALEEELLKDIEAAPAEIKRLVDFITSVKGNRLETLLEKYVWAGLGSFETTVLSDLQKLSALDEKLIGYLNLLFQKPAP